MLEQYVYKNQKKLRCGYTTGSCAAAAAKGATRLLLGQAVSEVTLMTPKGVTLTLPLLEVTRGEDWVACAVQKDSGDDPDATDGILIYARVTKSAGQVITVDGGVGVGRVTRAGLDNPVGAAAINKVPRQMILAAVEAVLETSDYVGGLTVLISVPQGEAIAKRTFNPRLGIVGGLSILGTTGIVEPMSEQALIDSIHLELKMRRAAGAEYLLITPGNYGEAFAKLQSRLALTESIKCSNYLGETLDYAVALGFRGVLLVAHLGKLVKVAGGIMNTHSRYADCRLELLTAHAALQGAPPELLWRIMACVTTDEALPLLDEAGIRAQTLDSLLTKIDFYLKARVHDQLTIGAIMFSNQYGLLGQTEAAESLADYFCRSSATVQENSDKNSDKNGGRAK